MVSARPDELETWPYHSSLRLFTVVRRSSCGPIACWILAQTSSLVTRSLYEKTLTLIPNNLKTVTITTWSKACVLSFHKNGLESRYRKHIKGMHAVEPSQKPTLVKSIAVESNKGGRLADWFNQLSIKKKRELQRTRGSISAPLPSSEAQAAIPLALWHHNCFT